MGSLLRLAALFAANTIALHAASGYPEIPGSSRCRTFCQISSWRRTDPHCDDDWGSEGWCPAVPRSALDFEARCLVRA